MFLRRNGSLVVKALAIMLSLFLLGSSFVLAEESSVKAFHYVALGDSLTAGYEPWMMDEWEKTQVIPAAYGFVERLYEQALYQGRTVLKNYGILGLTSKGLDNLLQSVEKSELITAPALQERILDPRTDDILAKYKEMKIEIENADLITITIGANDFLDLFTLVNEKSTEELQAIVNERITLYKENLTRSLETIFSINPNVKIVISDQYQPYPKMGNQAVFTQLDGYNKQLTAALEEVVQNFATTSNSIKIAYIGERFIGKELSYVNINLMEQEKSDPHPRQLGYEAMAKAFTEVIWGDYKVVSKKDPIGIVVKGKELQTPYKPVLENGTTYVPVREYVEGALGGEVTWDKESNSAIAKYNGMIVKYTANSNIIEVNGTEVEMNVPVRLIKINPNDTDFKTYVPLRALAEKGLQLDVQFIQKSNTAYINP